MELKQGFKQTEIGLIPADWMLVSIPSITKKGDTSIKIGPFGSALKKDLLVSNGYKVYGQENIFKNDMTIGKRFITHDHFNKLKTCEISPGDFLISMMGTVGKCLIVPTGIDQGIMDSHLLRIRLDNLKINSKYLYYIFQSKIIFDQVRQLSVGGIMEGLSSKIIKSLFAPMPSSLVEQTAIANTLIDTEKWIQSLNRLIVKKQNIKQGAMQNLLNPYENRELKKGWVSKELGEISKHSKGKGLSKSQLTINGKYPCIHYGELFTKYNESIECVFSRTNLNKDVYLSKSNDVLMPTSDVTPNGLATASCIKKNGVILGGDILVIRPNNSVLDGVFFSYLINIEREQVLQLVTGTTVYHLYGKDMAKFKMRLPKDLSEQVRIANILSDMDEEITALKNKLSKAKQIKEGMMQNLLTGKVRLL